MRTRPLVRRHRYFLDDTPVWIVWSPLAPSRSDFATWSEAIEYALSLSTKAA